MDHLNLAIGLATLDGDREECWQAKLCSCDAETSDRQQWEKK